ncbi:hypothetical protein OGAPHI_003237 [Ogataea philodendri]|uniref:Uncharacterized protein n=1 Tax=Ogataea philodendri TaxID=1378263 RepID=A0A9P8P6M4_9ASCO|nr:uncharacterized protein OGAPHI_003237 [Ogataea philodendri]KAH3666788.1 hypothetical protein OGAPHI_003237 [Ogataea philodendri]
MDPVRCLPWLLRTEAQITLMQSRNWLNATTRNSFEAYSTSSGLLVNMLVSWYLKSDIHPKLKKLRKHAVARATSMAIL